jgi:hypothetical protein
MITEATVNGGRRPDSDEEERQASTQLTISVPDSMAIEISQRVKARRRGEPHFSRNDLMRIMIGEYCSRHPFRGSP